MALASGANVGVSYIPEVVHGVTPDTPTMKALRVTGRNINLQRATLTSNERRNDRQIADLRHGFNQLSGSLGFELSLEAFDDWLEGALGGTWATAATTGSTSLATNSTGNKIIRTAGSFISDGFMVGDVVTLSGFATAGNNGETIIIDVTALQLTVVKTLVTDVAAATRSVVASGKKLKIGQTLKTYTIERRFVDIDQYQVFRGCAINQMSFNVQPDQIVGGTFDVIGMSSLGFSGTSLDDSPVDAPSNSPFDAFTANVYVDGGINTVVTGFNFSLNNQRSVNPVIGTKFSPDVFEGTCQITGQLSAYLEDASFYNYFYNEAEVSLFAKLPDPGGTGFIVLQLPRIKLSSGDIDPQQQGPIVVQYNFQALVDADSGTSVAFQRSNT
jgi:hypothetical protein